MNLFESMLYFSGFFNPNHPVILPSEERYAMKTVLLMRHAKSSWKEPKLADIERPLNKRGKKDAPAMGKTIRDKELIPQRIFCSPAMRARLTAESFVEKSHYQGQIEYIDSFYLAEPDVYLKSLQQLPDDMERVMIIGHNPGLEGLVQILSRQVASLPTAAIAHIILPIKHWDELNADTEGDLVEVLRPHDHKEKSKK
jgi:phosphohistidine phosphatase